MSLQLQLPTGSSLAIVRPIPPLREHQAGSTIKQFRDNEQQYLRLRWEEAHIKDPDVAGTMGWKRCKVTKKTEKLEDAPRSVISSLADSVRGRVFTFKEEIDLSKYHSDGLLSQILENLSPGDKLICHEQYCTIREAHPQGWATEAKNVQRGQVFWWFSRQQDPKSQGFLSMKSVTFEPVPEPPRQLTSAEQKKIQQAEKVQQAAENRKRKRDQKEAEKQQRRRAVQSRYASASQSAAGTSDDPVSLDNDDTQQTSPGESQSSSSSNQSRDDGAISSQGSPVHPQSSPPSSPESLSIDSTSNLLDGLDTQPLHTLKFVAKDFYPEIDPDVDHFVNQYHIMTGPRSIYRLDRMVSRKWKSYRDLVKEVSQLLGEQGYGADL